MARGCGVGRRCVLDLALLWLWYRTVAVALIRPLAWEPPYATAEVLKNKTKQNKTKKSQCRPSGEKAGRRVSLPPNAKEGEEEQGEKTCGQGLGLGKGPEG